jgi:hypothetical protein
MVPKRSTVILCPGMWSLVLHMYLVGRQRVHEPKASIHDVDHRVRAVRYIIHSYTSSFGQARLEHNLAVGTGCRASFARSSGSQDLNDNVTNDSRLISPAQQRFLTYSIQSPWPCVCPMWPEVYRGCTNRSMLYLRS